MTDEQREALKHEARVNVANRYPEVMGYEPNGTPLPNIPRKAILNRAWDDGSLVGDEFKRLLGLLEEVER